MSAERIPTFRCACGLQIAAVIFEATGLRGNLERAPGRLAIVQSLPGIGCTPGELPRVVATSQATSWREHLCPTQKAPSFSAANFNRKRRQHP